MGGKELVMSIFKKARGFWEARILMTAAELDIFSQLLDKPKTSKQVAKGLSSDPRATEMLLNSLVALELLVKEDGAFGIRPGLEGALSSSSPDTILPLILHMAHLWESWGELSDIVRDGKSQEPLEKIERGDEGADTEEEAAMVSGVSFSGTIVGDAQAYRDAAASSASFSQKADDFFSRETWEKVKKSAKHVGIGMVIGVALTILLVVRFRV